MNESDSYQKALEQCVLIKQMNLLSLELDVPFLKKAVSDMLENHRHRDSMMVLNPNPLTHNDQQGLNYAKITQLQNMLNLAETSQQIIELEKKLALSKLNASKFNDFFGNS
ncbi:MAG: hypothetical protein WCP32_10315 [Bacteroidota bacterium]